jgi:[ribosomal protein S18]-alanine N-acetyltransferase
MIITHARPEDLDAIVALEQAGFAAGEQWSVASWAAELDSDHCVLADTDNDGLILGVATFTCVEDLADLNRIVVRPDARGRGVGAALLRAGLEWAEALGATRMLLEVRTDNSPALALYARLGFDQISCRRDYYGVGVDAAVMLRPIGDEADAWAMV